MTDLSAALIAQTASIDPKLRPRMIALADLALKEAEYFIIHGDPRTKAAMINKFLSVLATQMQVKQQDEEMNELKAALEELRNAVVGYQVGGGDIGEQEEVPVDGPSKG